MTIPTSFFEFWLSVTGIGPTFSFFISWATCWTVSVGTQQVGFAVKLSDEAEVNVRAILNDMAKDPARYGASGSQIGDFYASWMDEAGIEARGTAPLRPYLQRVAAIRNRSDLIATFATPGYTAPVGIGIIPDLANPTRYTAIAGQRAGLRAMPSSAEPCPSPGPSHRAGR